MYELLGSLFEERDLAELVLLSSGLLGSSKIHVKVCGGAVAWDCGIGEKWMANRGELLFPSEF